MKHNIQRGEGIAGSRSEKVCDFALVSLGLLDCAPGVIATNGSNGCVEEANRATSIFNERLRVKIGFIIFLATSLVSQTSSYGTHIIYRTQTKAVAGGTPSHQLKELNFSRSCGWFHPQEVKHVRKERLHVKVSSYASTFSRARKEG
ncbi:uncharacterized protein LOC129314187 [Prosopis cineraria]|uniref:uncharacterized protein LOC129314187 n=1 Tax=Prosopis cineraria TaxID=364024 RepID=UPI00240FAFE4|nr:uncharacterized protein LOC129314187 [Prosopis cineraria]